MSEADLFSGQNNKHFVKLSLYNIHKLNIPVQVLIYFTYPVKYRVNLVIVNNLDLKFSADFHVS